MYFLIDKIKDYWYNYLVKYGGVAQLARAFGSYPTDRWFESTRRYQNDLFRQVVFFIPFKEMMLQDSCREQTKFRHKTVLKFYTR